MKAFIRAAVEDSIRIKQEILSQGNTVELVEIIAEIIADRFEQGNAVYFCGNGGSAGDAQHLAAELSGRFKMERKALPCEALQVNSSFVTAVANDYGFEYVFERAVEAFCKKEDVLFALSTSGNSSNIIKAVIKAKKLGVIVIGFTGRSGGDLVEYCDYTLCIPSDDTPRIQEGYMLLGHLICELVEQILFGNE